VKKQNDTLGASVGYNPPQLPRLPAVILLFTVGPLFGTPFFCWSKDMFIKN
jgi:hypothetical protein